MNNTFIANAIKIVTEAIDHDNKQEYEPALAKYKQALDHFMTGLKYEQNPASKATITTRVAGCVTPRHRRRRAATGTLSLSHPSAPAGT
jgi:hypothetical protein